MCVQQGKLKYMYIPVETDPRVILLPLGSTVHAIAQHIFVIRVQRWTRVFVGNVFAGRVFVGRVFVGRRVFVRRGFVAVVWREIGSVFVRDVRRGIEILQGKVDLERGPSAFVSRQAPPGIGVSVFVALAQEILGLLLACPFRQRPKLAQGRLACERVVEEGIELVDGDVPLLQTAIECPLRAFAETFFGRLGDGVRVVDGLSVCFDPLGTSLD
jgi:hypothetical protein